MIFDLREEARQISLLFHFVMASAIAIGAVSVAPRSVRARLPSALVDAARPLTYVLILATGLLGAMEYHERRQADALVELCLGGGCDRTEGEVRDIDRIRKITSGGRFITPTWGGYFKIGNQVFAHYPRGDYGNSPVNLLREGEHARVHSRDGLLVLVEVAD